MIIGIVFRISRRDGLALHGPGSHGSPRSARPGIFLIAALGSALPFPVSFAAARIARADHEARLLCCSEQSV